MTSSTTLAYPSEGGFITDESLNNLYPLPIQQLARRHWTPIGITKIVVDFLVPYEGVKVLDIGSGVGKFCLAGAFYKPSASFIGIEQRKDLTNHAQLAKGQLGLTNAHFIHGNLADLDFRQYDHFYFYNSFHENLLDQGKIDDNILFSPELYTLYNRLLYEKLDVLPIGTRLATFHTFEENIPDCYQMVEAKFSNLLRFWTKVK